MKARKQSTTSYPITFCMVSSTDHIAPVTGITPTVTISKNGGGFASPSGAVTDVGNGWYQLAGNATDRNTLGELLLHATGTGADPWDDRYTIVPFDPFDSATLGLTSLALEATVQAVKGKTDNLPSDPADESSIQATLATIAGYIDTEITDIRNRLPATLVGGKMDANLGSLTAAVLTAAAFAAGALNANALANDAVEEIALKVLTWASSNWEGSAAPKSLGTAVMKATHRIRDNAGTLEIFLSNGVTVHVSQTVTTDDTLKPIDELAGAT